MRKLLVFALLLAIVPAARAEGPPPAPEIRVVEVAAPEIRQNVQLAPAFAEELKTETRVAQMRMGGTTTAILLVLAAIGLIVLVRAL